MDRTLRRPRLTDILFLASTASAISLSSFQFIASSGVPLGCIIAYSTPLSGCSNDNFGLDNTCSDACVTSILRVTENLAGACESVNAAEGSVLGLAISGMLLQPLCPNNDFRTITTSSTSARVTTTTLRSTTRQTSTSTTQTTLSSSSVPLAADPPQSETTAAPTTTVAIGGGDGGNGQEPTATASPDEAQETPNFPGGFGSGSPFDAVFISSGSRQMSESSFQWKASLAVAMGVATVMLTL